MQNLNKLFGLDKIAERAEQLRKEQDASIHKYWGPGSTRKAAPPVPPPSVTPPGKPPRKPPLEPS